MNDAPIGVFDSGLGGLTVWSELRRRLPRESLLYYGDGKNCPYGDKTREQVTEAVDFAVRRLVDRGVKLIVVACNAATAMAIDHLRAAYPIPFVGLEPAVKPAALSSRSGVIGILATAATLRGKLFRETSRRYEDRVRIIARVGEGFVELVEQNRERTEEAYRRVERLLTPMIEAGADRIVLGCTHYPFLSDAPRDRRPRRPSGQSGGGRRATDRDSAVRGGNRGFRGQSARIRIYDQCRRSLPAAAGRQERGNAEDAVRVGGRAAASEVVRGGMRGGGGRTAVQGRFLFRNGGRVRSVLRLRKFPECGIRTARETGMQETRDPGRNRRSMRIASVRGVGKDEVRYRRIGGRPPDRKTLSSVVAH